MNMKKMCVAVALMCFATVAMAQTEVRSRIEKVTVYPSSALVEKCIVTSLQKGENKFIITGNARNVTTNDIHFGSSPDWFISSVNSNREVLSVKEMLGRELPQAAFNQYMALKSQLDDVQLRIVNANQLISTLAQQKQALNNLKAVKNTMAFDTIDNLKLQFEYQRKELQAINTLQVKTEQERYDLDARERQLTKEMDQILVKHLGGKQLLPTQNDLYVTIYSNKAVPNAKISYSYKVTSVTCRYAYDVMLDEDKKQAVFSLKTNVSQSSGEHWKDCQVVFSTIDAGYAGYDSELQPYYLDYYQPVQHRAYAAEPQAKAMKGYLNGAARNTITSVENEEAVFVAMDTAPAYSMSQSSNLTLSREYALQTRQTIASGDHQTILLHNDTTKVVFARFATPKNEEKVHFTAMLPDWEELGLLDASCDVYLNNKYVSVSDIVTAGTGDTMRFAIGQDRNVLVNRKFTKSSPDKSGVLAKEIVETATVTITIKNTKNESIELRLKDQVPLSNVSDLKVVDVKAEGGKLDSKTGVIRWNVQLKPLEQKTITFSYSVKYPKERENQVILR